MPSSQNPFLWSTSAAANDAIDPGINWAEGQAPGSVNGSARAMMAALAKLIADLNGTKSTAGSSPAYTIAAANIDHTVLSNGLMVAFRASFTNTTASTLNLNSIGAKPINVFSSAGEVSITAGQIVTGGHYLVQYDTSAAGGGGAWILLNPAFDTSEPTGSIKAYIGASAPAGYVRANGRTIGTTGSGATERANPDTLALYTLLYDSWSNTEAPVSGGRGATAALDFAALKTITLPDLRGRAPYGKGDMGNSDAARITNAESGIVGTTLGAAGGAQSVTLNTGSMPAHTHTITGNTGIEDAAHTHGVSGTTSTESAGHSHSGTTSSDGAHTHTAGGFVGTTTRVFATAAGFTLPSDAVLNPDTGSSGGHTHTMTTGAASAAHTHTVGITSATESANHTHTLPAATDSRGGGLSHNNMPGAMIALYIIKL